MSLAQNNNLPVLSKNQVVSLFEVPTLANGEYRILSTSEDMSLIVVFPLTSPNVVRSPLIISRDNLSDALGARVSHITGPALPKHMVMVETESSSHHRAIGKERYGFIKSLVEHNTFLMDYASKRRSPLVIEHAKSMTVPVQTIRRYLALFWYYGQVWEALIPAYCNSGGLNQIRAAGKIKRGRPRATRLDIFSQKEGQNISEADKTTIFKYLKKYYFTEAPKKISQIYKAMVIEQYSDSVSGEKNVPTIEQFRYWVKKLTDPVVVAKKQSYSSHYERNQRGIPKSANHQATFPGYCFEIDATVADVYIVSQFNRNLPIGRPTIYSIIDRASRLIVGLHVSHLYASWASARNAIVNASANKVDYCRRFELDINESDWPAYHFPMTLLCDRGEMIGLQPEKLLTPMMTLKIAPSYRADVKTIVEGRFKVFNDDLLHNLEGTTKGQIVKRGMPLPKTKALHTIDEVTKMLLMDVIAHNHRVFDELASTNSLLIENDLPATPTNYWNIHLANGRHGLISPDEISVRARLLPEQPMSVTKMGIAWGDLYYTCDKAEAEEWYSRARINGRWKVSGRVHENDPSHVFIWDDTEKNFLVCRLLERSKMFKGKSMVDIYYFQDWKKSKKPNANNISQKDVDAHHVVGEVTKQAKTQKKKAGKPPNPAQRYGNMKQRRREEVERLGNEDNDTDFVNSVSKEVGSKTLTELLPKQEHTDPAQQERPESGLDYLDKKFNYALEMLKHQKGKE